MKLEKVIQVDANEFYEHLLKSVQYDIESCTQKKMPLDTIKSGVSYKKSLKNKIGRGDLVTVTLTQLIEPKVYEAEFKGTQGTTRMTYTIETLDKMSSKVIYEEAFESTSKVKNMNHKIMTFFYKRQSRKRSEQLINHIESYIIENRQS